jgi:hypothetical protein
MRYNEELHRMYSSSTIIRITKRRTGHVAGISEKQEYRIFIGKPEGERPLGRPKRSRKDNIRMDMVGWYRMNWSVPAHGPVACSCEHNNELPSSIK